MASTGSTRYEGDTWDLASSVGVTATMVAAGRAIATRAENPLINDPFAEPLVQAVGVDLLARLASGELTAAEFDQDAPRTMTRATSLARMADNMAIRTKYFDEFFLDATAAGIRQVVILASGLDSRAYRLPWPAATVVYEIDQPQVVEFKTRTLAELNASPTADRRAVAIDLRDDWPAALRGAGFDPGQPTAWSAEGLLGYLPPEAQDRLLDTITELSAPGSRLATESVRNIEPGHEERMKERMKSLSDRWRAYGFDVDMTGLVYFGDRNEPAAYLTDHGWLLSESNARELLADNGLPAIEDEAMPMPELFYVSATLYRMPETSVRTAMPRTHDDNWDLASSVGVTATMVAAGRAMATRDPRGLINDPFAEPLVRAVGMEFFAKMIDGELDLSAIGNGSPDRTQAMINGMAVRTKFFDDYFSNATDGGVRQAVILASGLDARAYRLPWPDGTVVYEIDQPQVIEFKTNTLAGIGAEPTATRRTVAIDLRGDWPAALQAAGFDASAPTAWLAEGLLIYLPPDAQDRLFDNITALSVPGSTVATEFVPGIVNFDADRMREMSAPFREHIDIDMPSLIYAGERNHVVDYLKAKNWDADGVTRTELLRHNGLDILPLEFDDPLGEIIFISGELSG